MSTETTYTRGGIKIQCGSSRYPPPQPKGAWPVPAFTSAESSLITVTLVNLTGGAIGIRVQSVGALVGGSSAAWAILDQFWQGTAPDPLPQPTVIPVTLGNGTLDYTITAPLTGATHRIWVRRTEAGQVVDYPYSEVSVTAPTMATPTRTTASGTTGTLAAGASADLELTLAKSAEILAIETDYPAWVRVYNRTAARSADATREATTWPTDGSGLVAQCDTVSALKILFDPQPSISNKESSVTASAFLSVKNLDSVARVITVTITYLPKEI